jgi:lysophospholipase L1-like esterase
MINPLRGDSDMRARQWKTMGWLVGAALLLVSRTAPLTAQAKAAPEHWVATWGTAQEIYRAPPPPGQAQPAPAPEPEGPVSLGFRTTRTFDNQTVRMIVRTSLGGRRARVKLSSAFGSPTVTVGSAHVALHQQGSAIVPGSDRALTFAGKPAVTLMPGTVVLSDPVDLDIPANGELAVSLFLPRDTGRPSSHALGMHTTYVSRQGDFTSAPEIAADTTTQSYYWLDGVEVVSPADAAVVVGFGDSITDGARSTPDANAMWLPVLAARLAKNPRTAHIGVSNAGISGNQVLRDGAGVGTLARLDRDVLSEAGAKWMIVLEGINDIGNLGRTPPGPAVSADELIAAYRQIIEQAHARGIKVIGATLTPFQGAGYYSEAGEAIRETVNRFIRSPGAFDATIDFDAATRDPANPKRFRPEFDPGDHLHPNDAGYKAMGEAIDLSIFK